jgi:biotin carboxylase
MGRHRRFELLTVDSPSTSFNRLSVYHGYAIPPFYDSLVGKLIIHGKTTRTSSPAPGRIAVAAVSSGRRSDRIICRQ